MPPVFEKNCKLKVIEYGEHCNNDLFEQGQIWAGFRGWFKQLFQK